MSHSRRTLTSALSFVHLSFHASSSCRGTVSLSASPPGAPAPEAMAEAAEGASLAALAPSASFPCNAAVAADAAPQNEFTIKLAVSSTFFTNSSFPSTPASAAAVPTSPAGPATAAFAIAASSLAVARSASRRLILIFAFLAHSMRASRDSSCFPVAGASLWKKKADDACREVSGVNWFHHLPLLHHGSVTLYTRYSSANSSFREFDL